MKNRQLKVWCSFGLFLIVNSVLYTNCSNEFKAVELAPIEQVTSVDPTPVTPAPGDANPAEPSPPPQPQPAPIVPISMNSNPSWMAGKSLNEWIEIPNTSGAGGTAIDAFCGLALREATSQIIIGAAGGHGDGSDNRVVSLVLEADQPKWVMHIAGSNVPAANVSHYPDGTPASRHTYQHNYYVESLNRLFLVGARYTVGLSYTYQDVDAFSFETNQWDPPGTWAPIPKESQYGAVKIPGKDDIFTSSLFKWSALEATNMYRLGKSNSPTVWSQPITTRTNTFIRWPLAYDKSRNQLFNLQIGDGQGYSLNLGVQSSRIDLNTNVQTKITFKPSSAYDTFLAEAPPYAAMDYDPENDRFLFYSGLGAAAGRVYVIKPSSTSNEWEMSLLQTTANSVKPPPSMSAGINSNFKYVPRLKGFILLPKSSENLYFLKTAQ